MRRGIALLAIVFVAGSAEAASAATYQVTKRGDHVPGACTPADCTLREAVVAANNSVGVADQIVLPSRKTYTLSIPDAMTGAESGDLDVNNDPLRIVHPGKGRATIDQDAADRLFDIAGGAATTLRKLVITGGHDPTDDSFGGGIRSSEDLRLISSVVTGNSATDCGGGIHTQTGADLLLRGSRVTRNRAGGQAGGVSASCFGGAGELTMKNSTIAGNRSDSDDNGNGYGGGMYLQTSSDTESTITNSTFAGNSSGPGPLNGSSGGGLYTDLGILRVTGSTFSRNRAGDAGGGIHVDGTEPLVIVNSTIANNRANANGGGINADGREVVLNAVTVVRNHGNADNVLSEAGGGIANDSEPFSVRNSLIALNTIGALTPGDPPIKNDCSAAAPFLSGGHNLLSTRSFCDGFDGPGDRRRRVKIGRLKRNGGPTKTVALKKRSPAINKAKRQTAPNRDQRGHKRGRRPDIGAFERG